MNKKNKKYISTQALEELEGIIGYKFQTIAVLQEAITHSSFANENRNQQMKDNERLEFLGDAILDLIVSEYLFKKHPEMPEGDLSKIRASIVCEASLAKVSRENALGQYILLGKGEEITGGRQRASILADMFEAITGAIFVDGEFEDVRRFITNTLIQSVDHLSIEDLYTDYKTLLQENIQKESTMPIRYEVVEEKGPDHDKDFYVEVSHGELCLGRGIGKSKKEAEQNAARVAIKNLKEKSI
ncbi:MAG: ribonuclease III [Cellulosilyticaceae bacterium]